MASPRFEYRPAVGSDVAEMVQVHHASVHAIGQEYYSDDILSAWSPTPDDRRRRWLSDLIAEPSTIAGVAISAQQRLAGFCIALTSLAQLKALYVHPDFSGQGVGGGLLNFAETGCRSRGLVSLELNASHNAERFYARHGYHAIGPTSQPLGESGAMGAVLMVKSLASAA